MAQAQTAKIIKIELHVGGGSGGTGSPKKPNDPRTPIQKRFDSKMKSKLAGFAAVGVASQLVSGAISMADTISYNSQEKTSLMLLSMGKTAISGVITGVSILGGPVGAAVGMMINQLVVETAANQGEIAIKRNLDQTRITNRFYQTNFASNGNMVFDNSRNMYVNESLDKVTKSTCYKRGDVR
jgi:hypothetical protein